MVNPQEDRSTPVTDAFGSRKVDGSGARGVAKWDQFFAAWMPEVRRYFARDPSTANHREALAWDALVTVFVTTRDKQLDDSRVRAAIRAEMRQLAREHKRHSRREVPLVAIGDPPDTRTQSIERNAERARLWEWERAALARLPEQWCAAVELHLDKVPDRKIAHVLQCRIATVRKWRHRAMRELRRIARDFPPPNGLHGTC